VTVGLALLRVTGVTALLVLLWNPVTTHPAPNAPPLVLLDASLSMAGYGGRWREALDSARALAQGGPIWRFGASVAPFDTLPPTDGTTALKPALVAAASRGGPIAVISDGAIDDGDQIAPDLRVAPQVVLLARGEFRDYFVASITGPHRVEASDTLRLAVVCGTAGPRARGPVRATLVARTAGRNVAAQPVTLPDSGSVAVPLALPAISLPAGWVVLDVKLEGVRDSEPRDDGRLFVVDVNAAPTTVVLAAPPDWDVRFLSRTLAALSGGPVRTFAQIRRGTSEASWVEGTTLASVSADVVRRAMRTAALVVVAGAPTPGAPITAPAMLRLAPATSAGEWYVDLPPASPLAAALAGVAWDSLPPLVGVEPEADTGAVVLTARLARRGEPQPVVALTERGGVRRATIAGAGLYRWAFRGGRNEEAYRTLMAALADWLLGAHTPQSVRATPVGLVADDGTPVRWRWSGAGTPHDLVARFRSSAGEQTDTLRFGPDGQSSVRLPPAAYAYEFDGGPERGVVAVDTASPEWPPRPPTLRAQPGRATARVETVSARDRGALFGLALAAFAAEWAWRRRSGLP